MCTGKCAVDSYSPLSKTVMELIGFCWVFFQINSVLFYHTVAHGENRL